MQEFINLQQQCLSLMKQSGKCEGDCPLNHYCQEMQCNEGDCSNCMHRIQFENRLFTYSCYRITYHYVLRFFNRFSSEIFHLMDRIDYTNCSDINVVSLGCGPGSEVYGIIKSLQTKNTAIILHYEGHDLNSIWEPVQTMSKDCLKQLPHDVNFFTTDLFNDFHGFTNNQVDLLVLNYLLSDAVKFMFMDKREEFIQEIVDFVLEHNVRNILFNDITYYGHFNKLDSGIQLMELLIQNLKEKGKNFETYYYSFSDNQMLKDKGWKKYDSNLNMLPILKDNDYMENIGHCNSAQIYINIK
jgi:hypothetical protein